MRLMKSGERENPTSVDFLLLFSFTGVYIYENMYKICSGFYGKGDKTKENRAREIIFS